MSSEYKTWLVDRTVTAVSRCVAVCGVGSARGCPGAVGAMNGVLRALSRAEDPMDVVRVG